MLKYLPVISKTENIFKKNEMVIIENRKFVKVIPIYIYFILKAAVLPKKHDRNSGRFYSNMIKYSNI